MSTDISFNLKNTRIGIIGLGYVGLPLAVEFAKRYKVIGFDTDAQRIAALKKADDSICDTAPSVIKNLLHQQLSGQAGLGFSDQIGDLKDCNVFIVTVPTPIDQYKAPDLSFLLKASAAIGGVLKPGDTVIYESTVYPGCTEDDCVPVLESISGLKFNKDFYAGYSPERINPGDKVNTLTTIKKVTSGSTEKVADFVDELYRTIITAGTFKAASIKIAEASKAIENAQRDINISFVNELALIFDKLAIDTNDVLDAAATKWNFLKYKPGLVGGHCIGVDPYYLAHKAQTVGYYPEVILSGRRVNDNMGTFVANKAIKLLIKKGNPIAGAQALLLGITFKENCADIRNSRVIDIYRELREFEIDVDVYDPHANKENVKHEYGIEIINKLPDAAGKEKLYDVIILAVAHKEFLVLNLQSIKTPTGVIYDTKAVLNRDNVDGRL